MKRFTLDGIRRRSSRSRRRTPILECLEQRALLNAGDLDLTFGIGGKVKTSIGAANDYAYGLALDSNGKIVVAGESFNGANYDIALARYSVDGSLDTSFDGDGKLTTDFDSSDDEVYQVVIDKRGRIVVAGVYGDHPGNGNYGSFALARYNADGKLDTSFDGDGKVITDFFPASDGALNIAIDANDRIVVAGDTREPGNNNFALARYDEDGRLDTSFDGDGKVTTDFGQQDHGIGMAIDGQGRIVVVGWSEPSGNVSARNFALARYRTDGSLDPAFGSGGMLTTDFGGAIDAAISVKIDNIGRIIVSGYSEPNVGNENFALARYHADGTLDTSFDGDGLVTTAFSSKTDEAINLAIDADGKIVAAGYAFNGADYDFALARYNDDGSLDLDFNDDGKVLTDFGSGDDYGYRVALDAAGKVVVSGYVFNGHDYDFALARYLADDDGNQPPIASDDSATTTVSIPIHIDDLANDTDTEHDPLTIRILSQPIVGGGSAAVDQHGTPNDSTDDRIYYIPGLAGTYSFTYKLNDGHSDSNVATVTVTVSPPFVNLTARHWTARPWNVVTIPEDREVSPGVGLRFNSDDDDLNGTPDWQDTSVKWEGDLARLDLYVSAPASPDYKYFLVRSNTLVNVWGTQTKDTTFLGPGGPNIVPLVFSTTGENAGKLPLWVEQSADESKGTLITLQTRLGSNGPVVSEDTIQFHRDRRVANVRDLGRLFGKPPTIVERLLWRPEFNTYTRFELENEGDVHKSYFNLIARDVDSPIDHSQIANPNVKLFDANGTLVDSSTHYTGSPDTISRILSDNTYFLNVYRGVNSAYDALFSLDLEAWTFDTNRSFVDGVVSLGGRPDPYSVELKRIDGAENTTAIQSDIRTWVVIHGRGDGAFKPESTILPLAKAIVENAGGDGIPFQVLMLDWSQSAGDNFSEDFGLRGALWIPNVARWAARTLDAIGIHGSQLNLIGHSWGTFVAFEISEQIARFSTLAPQPVNTLVALDPAADAWGGYRASRVDYKKYTKWSWAFEGSLYGSKTRASTALESFEVHAPGKDARETHGNVVRLFTTIVKQPEAALFSGRLSLSQLLRLAQDGSAVRYFKENTIRGFLGIRSFEGFITGEAIYSHGALTWWPASLQYTRKADGQVIRESTSIDSSGDNQIISDAGDFSYRSFKIGRLDGVWAPPVEPERWVGEANPADWYSFSLSSRSQVVLNLDGPAGSTAFVLIFKPFDPIPIGAKSIIGDPISLELGPATYYVMVSYIPYDPVTGIGSPDSIYRLHLTATRA